MVEGVEWGVKPPKRGEAGGEPPRIFQLLSLSFAGQKH